MITRGLTLNDTLRKTLNLPQIIDIADKLPKHKTKVWPQRDFAEWKENVLHHADSNSPIENQADYHIDHHDWPGIAYHFCVYQGNIYQVNDLASRTSHAKGVNDTSVAICVIGRLQLRPLTQFERNAITGLALMLKELNPTVIVEGHNEASKRAANHITLCPCTDLDRIRDDIEAVEAQLIYQASAQKKEEIAFRVANHMSWLSNMAFGKLADGTPKETPGKQKWAKEQIYLLYPDLLKHKMLK